MTSGWTWQHSLQWQAFVCLFTVICFAQHCTSFEDVPKVRMQRSSPHTSVDEAALTSERSFPSRTLRFALCDSFANQRIAIASGVIFAQLLGRSAVLPDAVADETQATDEGNHGQLEGQVPLSAVYDTEVRTWNTERLHKVIL